MGPMDIGFTKRHPRSHIDEKPPKPPYRSCGQGLLIVRTVCGTNAAGDRRAAEARRSSKIDDLVDIEAVDIA